MAATVLAVLATESQGTGNLGLFPVIVLMFGPLGDLVAKVQDKARGSSGGDPVAVALAGALVVTAAYPYAESVLRRATTMAVHHVASMRRETAVDGVVGRALVAGQMSRTADLYTAFWHGPEPIRTIVRDGEAAFSGGLNPTEPAMSLAWAREVAAMANLVRRRHLVQSTMHVTTLGFVEPFGRLLGALPTPGTRLWLDPLRTVGRPTVEEARAYLEKADAVFVQRCPDKEPLRDLIATSFSAVLDREFTRADATPCYEVWLRTSR
ncbi:hypothetical protein FF100_07650 [Methylobacterium terricola]|uniref:Uncharacterized protein n=1 Tax=Methylobacterium terricola TaxID=2583531 RepID=A0A5C4LPJ0_9HYPH|nr:hypothetical protein FF100_07650 [Methylobacterium terricola]